MWYIVGMFLLTITGIVATMVLIFRWGAKKMIAAEHRAPKLKIIIHRGHIWLSLGHDSDPGCFQRIDQSFVIPMFSDLEFLIELTHGAEISVCSDFTELHLLALDCTDATGLKIVNKTIGNPTVETESFHAIKITGSELQVGILHRILARVDGERDPEANLSPDKEEL